MSEHTEQAALFEWAAWNQSRDAALNMLYAVPNGGKRDKVTAAKLKAEGVKAGVPDVFLPVARMGFHGCYIELKTDTGKPSKEQLEWGKQLTEQGYAWSICRGWQNAAYCIVRYLGHDGTDYGLPWH